MISAGARPTFLVRSVLLELGQPRTGLEHSIPELDRYALHVNSVEVAWMALDPLVTTLTLAGWDVTEVLVAMPGGSPTAEVAGYLQLFPHTPVVSWNPGDWRARTGAEVSAGTWVVIMVRVKVRRTLGAPSPYPPLPLDSLPQYRRAPEPVDNLADPADGWLVLSSTEHFVVTAFERAPEPVRQTVAASLAAEYRREGAGGRVGLLGALNPVLWETAVTADLPVGRITDLAAAVWQWLTGAGRLEAFLSAAPSDPATRLEGLALAAGAAGGIPGAMQDLGARMASLHPRRLGGPPTKGWQRAHWVLTLFELHELALLRVLPFPLAFEQRIPTVDVTGWYESDTAPFDPGVGTPPLIRTMQLNQAGGFVRGWWSDESLTTWQLTSVGPPAAGAGGTLSFEALLALDDDADLENAFVSGIPAQDTPGGLFAVTVRFRGVDHRLVRVSHRAQIDPARRVAELGQDLGLSTGHFASMHRVSLLGVSACVRLLADWVVRMTMLPYDAWPSAVRDLVGQLQRALADNAVMVWAGTTGVPAVPMLERFRVETRVGLLTTPTPGGDRSDAWTELRFILLSASVVVDALTATQALQALLGISATPHQYDFQFGGLGVVGELDEGLGLEGGGLIVGGTLSHANGCGTGGPHGWDDWVWGTMADFGISAGPQAGAGLNFVWLADPDTVYAESEWLADDFALTGVTIPTRCVFGMLSGSVVGGGRWDVGGEVGWDLIEGTLFVSRTARGIATGVNNGVFGTAGIGFAAGLAVAGGLSFGTLFGRAGSANPIDPADLPRPPEPPPPASFDASRPTFFDSGMDTLTDAGRTFLAVFVADNRAWLSRRCRGSGSRATRARSAANRTTSRSPGGGPAPSSPRSPACSRRRAGARSR